MNEDPIVEEVRRVRDKLAARFNYDIHAIFADLMARDRVPDPAHPLVKDVGEWADAGENTLALKEAQPRQD
jgi:hypothetical protein